MDAIEELFAGFSINSYLLYEAIVTSTDGYVYIVDMKDDMALVSENMHRDFELPSRSVHRLPAIWGELLHPRDRKRFFDSMERMVSGEVEDHNLEYQVKNRKGEYIWVVCRGILKRKPDGEPDFFAGIVTDLGDKGKIDYTTGLFTQRECEKQVTQTLRQSRGENRGGILLLGMDDFTRVNNLNDHIFGDMVLRQFAQDIQDRLPASGDIFRFDGDELAVLLRNATEQDLIDFYHKVHIYCNRRHDVGGVSYFCTASGGIAMLARDGNDFMSLLKCADSALEESKRRGKNTYTVFTPDLIETELRAQELVNQLQLSVTNGMEGFSLSFQPLVRANDSQIVGAEALLRWSYSGAENVGPMEFVPLLESSGLMLPVGTWVLEMAAATCKRWLACCPDFVMNVNISYLQMIAPGFVDLVRATLERYGLEPRHIVLEMTESYFVTDIETLEGIFQALRALGVRIAMDDFGTGYSSLGMLARLPADEVKIDRAFISEISRNSFNRSFIGAVIQLCHSVGMVVCVEGIETGEEYGIVLSLGADNVQGFRFSKPIPEAEFHEKYWNGVLCGV